jgi:nucleotide-binding universal stress UspA family protein
MKKRQGYEEGHSPKFLLLVDKSQEFDRALSFAARRALRLNLGVVLLATLNLDEFAGQHLFGVGTIMREEAQSEAESRLERAATRLKRLGLTKIETELRSGKPAELIAQIISEDSDIITLVLAAGTDIEGPGPLVTSLAKTAGTFAIPILIVPGHLSEEEISAVS